MDLEQEIYEAIGYVERSGFYPEAVKAIRAALAEVQKPTHNKQSTPCRYSTCDYQVCNCSDDPPKCGSND